MPFRIKLLFLSVICLISSSVVAIEIGDGCPNFELLDAKGLKVNYATQSQSYTLLDFWASWCAPCKKSLGYFNDLQKRYAAKGLRVVAVNLDSEREDADKLIQQINPQYQVLFDPQGSLASQLRIKAMPSSLLIDPNGRVISIFEGFDSEDKLKIERSVSEALKGQNW